MTINITEITRSVVQRWLHQTGANVTESEANHLEAMIGQELYEVARQIHQEERAYWAKLLKFTGKKEEVHETHE